MQFLKSALTASALVLLTSALRLERQEERLGALEAPTFATAPSIATACEKEDEADCKEYCELSSQTATCIAKGNKITCVCKGGKSETNCEERCLFCMPDKMAMEEAKAVFHTAGQRVGEL